MTTRRAVDFSDTGRAGAIPAAARGAAGAVMVESLPKYVKANNEHVIKDTNGSYIVLGRDRNASRLSGLGHTHGSARIDLVVGRMSAHEPPIKGHDGEGNILFVDNSFEKDAARIYISQKANIDDYFDLKSGTVGMSRTRSGIGVKADAVRIIGREGIKLVTRPEPKNSMGGLIERVAGIDLIAGNDDTDLQPMVKGNNLIRTLESMQTSIGKLNGIVTGILIEQMQLNAAISIHTHEGVTSAGMVVKTIPSIDIQPVAGKVAYGHLSKGILPLMIHRITSPFINFNNLMPFGRNYILSRYNNTN